MSKPVKVFNKGTRPVVFKRGRMGVDAIHPRKFKTFNGKVAKGIIEKYKHACSEGDYKKHLDELAKKQAEDQKKAAIEAKKQKDARDKAAIEAEKEVNPKD